MTDMIAVRQNILNIATIDGIKATPKACTAFLWTNDMERYRFDDEDRDCYIELIKLYRKHHALFVIVSTPDTTSADLALRN